MDQGASLKHVLQPESTLEKLIPPVTHPNLLKTQVAPSQDQFSNLLLAGGQSPNKRREATMTAGPSQLSVETYSDCSAQS
jgi:hypothetical protein